MARKDPHQEERRAEVERRFRHGQGVTAIAQALGSTPSQVSRDLTANRKALAAELSQSAEEKKVDLLGEVRQLKRDFQEGYEESCRQRQIRGSSQVQGARTSTQTAHLRFEPGKPDARFLEGVGSCIEKEGELKGLDQEATAEPPAEPQLFGMDAEEGFERMLNWIRDEIQGMRAPRVQPGDVLPPGFSLPEDYDPDAADEREEDWMTRIVHKVFEKERFRPRASGHEPGQ